MLNVNDVKLLKIIKYLIVECDYRIIYTKESKNDVFLESIDSEDPQIIQLSFKQLAFNNNFEEEINETKKIINKIRKKTFKIKLKTLVIFFNNSNIKPPNEDQNLEIITLNHNLGKLKTKFPKIEKIWKNEKNEESVETILKQIAVYSNQQLSNIKKRYGKRKIDANKIFVSQLIWVNFLLFVFGSFAATYSGVKTYELIYPNFSSTFETVFLHNQYWRLLISGFIGINVFSTVISIFIISIIGRFVVQMYGNIKYFVIILITTVFSQFIGSLTLPGLVVIGLDSIIFGLVGSIIYFAQINRVVFINVFWKQVQLYLLFLLLPPIILGSWVTLALSLISLSLGFLSAMVVDSFYKKMMSFWVSFSFLLILAVGLSTTWTYFPKRYPGLELYDETFFKAYSFIYDDGAELQNKICTYYQFNEQNCSLIGKEK